MSARWIRTNTIADDVALIAVSFDRFGDAMMFPGYGRCRQAMIRGESPIREAGFRFESAYLNAERQKPVERLREHGFTVVELPSNWRYGYSSPQDWQSQLIVKALNRVNELHPTTEVRRPCGYDIELANAVLESLNEAFPNSVTLMQLKYQFGEEPSDDVLSTGLNALRGDGLIDGKALQDVAKLSPLERIALTKEGRRYLQDDMKRRSRNLQQGYTVNESSQFILAQLLAEFRERKLTSDDLRNTYQGLPPRELKERSIAEGISEVDFDLAMRDLDSHELVKTGPMTLYDNPPHSSVTVIAFISKNEYSYLTENGYREATALPSRLRKTSSAAHIHISDSTFHNSPIGVGDGFAQTVISPTSSVGDSLSAFRSEVIKLIDDEAKQREILSRLDELEASTDKPTMLQRYNNLVATIGNHITVFGPLLPPLLDKLMR